MCPLSRSVHPLLLAWALLFVATCAACSAADRSDRSAGSGGSPATATVVRVVDGDTVVLRLHGRDETVRLLGIDTPETVKPGSPVECFGPEASANLKHLLPPGTAVRVERDVEVRDRFGRLLLYLFRSGDDAFVNRLQVAGGFARPLAIGPNRARTQSFDEAASAARSEHRGLWAACGPDG